MLYMVQLDKRPHSVPRVKIKLSTKNNDVIMLFPRLSVNDADATGHVCVYV